MRDIQNVLTLWGAWAASDACRLDYSPVAAGFRGLLPYTSKTRLACSDDDGLVIEGCLSRLKHKRPYDHELLVIHYLYQVPKRQIAKQRKKSEKQIRIEMQLAEGFIEGCLSMLDIHLEMDLWLGRENNKKKSNAVRIF